MASTALTGNTSVIINLAHKKAIDLSTILDELKISSNIDWSWGTGANAANLLFHDQRSTDDTGETLDLYASGSLTNAFGEALTMTALKLLYIKNTHASLTLELFGGVSLDLLIVANTSDIVEVPPGGVFLFTAPTAAGIVTTTNKNLFVASKTSGTITYDIVALGLD